MGKPVWQLSSNERRMQQEEDRKKAMGDKKSLLSRLIVKTPVKVAKVAKSKFDKVRKTEPVIPVIAISGQDVLPKTLVTVAGKDPIKFYSRSSTDAALYLQPWAKEMTAFIMDAVVNAGVHIYLAWPAAFESIVPLHAIANIEKIFETDLNGFRTMLYPGNHNSRTALQSVLVDRTRISDFYQSLFKSTDKGGVLEAETRSLSFEALLLALNNIRNYHDHEVEDPSLGELFPAFIYDDNVKDWVTTAHAPLERSMVKVDNLGLRKDVRSVVHSEWGDSVKAPGALMVIHNSAKKTNWKDALSNKAVNGFGKPELLLLDATGSAERTNFNAVQKIPDFLKYAIDHGYEKTGAVIITDDPKTYFAMRAKLKTLKIIANCHIWAAEGEDSILSRSPFRDGWRPAIPSNSKFSISIVDRDASQIALNFQRLGNEMGDQQSTAYKSLMDACSYLLRLSNLPAGYIDLTEFNNQEEDNVFIKQANAWAPVESAILKVLNAGELNTRRTETLSAIEKAKKLIDDWSDATPMAACLLVDIKKYTTSGYEGITIVLPSRKYIQIAIRYIERKLGEAWIGIKDKVIWHTLSSIRSSLEIQSVARHLTFVGLNNHVLRILLTEKRISFGTTVLIAYKQADSALLSLKSMKDIKVFDSYRGRICELSDAIERRISEVPNPIQIGRLGDLKMTFSLQDESAILGDSESEAYKIEIEGGDQIYSSGYIYKHVPDQDPFFERVFARSIKSGDLVFDMSDELKDKVESALYSDESGVDATVYPERALLRLYHDDVKLRCNLFFPGITKRSKLAKAIHNKMIAIDSVSKDCNPSNVYYWLDIQNKSDTRPHAPKSAKFFKIFCNALEMTDDQATQNWNFIKNARRLSINLGRELSLRYAEILFRPNSAMINRKIPETIIQQLRQDALLCVYRVNQVTPPMKKSNLSN